MAPSLLHESARAPSSFTPPAARREGGRSAEGAPAPQLSSSLSGVRAFGDTDASPMVPRRGKPKVPGPILEVDLPGGCERISCNGCEPIARHFFEQAHWDPFAILRPGQCSASITVKKCNVLQDPRGLDGFVCWGDGHVNCGGKLHTEGYVVRLPRGRGAPKDGVVKPITVRTKYVIADYAVWCDNGVPMIQLIYWDRF